MADEVNNSFKCSPTTKLQAQKNPCIGYNLHSIVSCNTGVISPTRKLKAQFVAVEIDTPLARTVKGMIYEEEVVKT